MLSEVEEVPDAQEESGDDDDGDDEDRTLCERHKFLTEHPHFDETVFPPNSDGVPTVLNEDETTAAVHRSYYQPTCRPLIDRRGNHVFSAGAWTDVEEQLLSMWNVPPTLGERLDYEEEGETRQLKPVEPLSVEDFCMQYSREVLRANCSMLAGAKLLNFFMKNAAWLRDLSENGPKFELETVMGSLFDKSIPRAGLTVIVFDTYTSKYLVFYSNQK